MNITSKAPIPGVNLYDLAVLRQHCLIGAEDTEHDEVLAAYAASVIEDIELTTGLTISPVTVTAEIEPGDFDGDILTLQYCPVSDISMDVAFSTFTRQSSTRVR